MFEIPVGAVRVTDEERREVAARLRNDVSESECIDYAAFRIIHDVLGIENATGAKAAHALADLIDRPTCQLVLTDTETHGNAKVRCYECSYCGGACEETYGKYEHCPHCGAVVVE